MQQEDAYPMNQAVKRHVALLNPDDVRSLEQPKNGHLPEAAQDYPFLVCEFDMPADASQPVVVSLDDVMAVEKAEDVVPLIEGRRIWVYSSAWTHRHLAAHCDLGRFEISSVYDTARSLGEDFANVYAMG